ncbi:hypothetical protein [Paenibacillus antibioticophila]|uniref:hypothetical protein n=1 Tax=Paenibacillus antibioticophila TaxID=1274374 RepID=UPI001F2C7460|nr:hypothetical protein [Paenibacillus antibioticophila]
MDDLMGDGTNLKIYKSKKIQISISLLYPIVVFLILNLAPLLHSWLLPAIVSIGFCLLWGNLRYLFFSTLLMWITSVPIWWLFIERSREGDGAEIFISSLPFIIVAFVFVVLLPEILLVLVRNKYFLK